MTSVRKALRFCKVSFKILSIRANTVRREQYRQSCIPLDSGSPRWCSIEWATDPHAACRAVPACSRVSHILVIRAITELSSEETTLFIISTGKQKGCPYENFSEHL